MPGYPRPSRKIGDTIKRAEGSSSVLPARWICSRGIPATFVTEPVEMQMGGHTKILSFIVVPGIELPLVLRLAWLKK